jgi:hypothetical protein
MKLEGRMEEMEVEIMMKIAELLLELCAEAEAVTSQLSSHRQCVRSVERSSRYVVSEMLLYDVSQSIHPCFVRPTSDQGARTMQCLGLRQQEPQILALAMMPVDLISRKIWALVQIGHNTLMLQRSNKPGMQGSSHCMLNCTFRISSSNATTAMLKLTKPSSFENRDRPGT